MVKNINIQASLYLASYLDTLGFNNGLYEFNFSSGRLKNYTEALKINMEIFTDFLHNGGFKNFDIKNKNASDDTIMLIATGKAIVDGKADFDSFRKEYVKVHELLKKEKIRGTGLRTLDSIRNLVRFDKKENIFVYQENGGGNGAAMRSSVIGIKYHNDVENIVNKSMLSARMTHNNPLGYIGAILVSLFTSFALSEIEPWKWIDRFIELYQDKKINIDYLRGEEKTFDKYVVKLEEFNKYLKKFIYKKNPDIVNMLLMNNFEPGFNGMNYENYGATGFGVIVASLYCLLTSIKIKDTSKPLSLKNCYPNWDVLVLNSALSFGDSDTIGIVVGGWYGALFGYTNVPEIKLKELEFYNELTYLAKKLKI